MRAVTWVPMGLAAGLLAGCMVGPDYHRPDAPVAATFSEAPGPSSAAAGGWRPADPKDQTLRAEWWKLFGDPTLDALEAQVDTGNQTLKQAEANFRVARAAVRFQRSNLLPTIGAAPSGGVERVSANEPYFSRAAANNGVNDFSAPLDLNYEVDLWGRVRRSVNSARDSAQAAAADTENVRLALHAELAGDYFNLRAAIATQQLLDATVKAYEDALREKFFHF